MSEHYSRRKHSPWAQAWRRLKNSPVAIFSFAFLILIGTLCFLAPVIAPYSYEVQNLNEAIEPPSAKHWLGTDMLGRDLLSRILYGGRISFFVGLCASFVSLTIGVIYGSISGWFGGMVDRFLMRTVEIVYSLPYTIFVILLMVFIGRGLMPLFIAIGAVEWLTMARLVRGQVGYIKKQSFIQAAETLGQTQGRTIIKHIIPNITTTIVVCVTLTIPNIILLESFISFLGLGVQAPMTSWGLLIREGSQAMESAPWLLAFPAVFFSLTLFSLNFLGDGLRDALDPRSEMK